MFYQLFFTCTEAWMLRCELPCSSFAATALRLFHQELSAIRTDPQMMRPGCQAIPCRRQ